MSSQLRTTEPRTYTREECAVFRKTKELYGGLSNMASGFPLRVNERSIRTSEVLYQLCRFPHLHDVQEMLITERSPMTAKMKSKPYRAQSRADFEHLKVKIMRWCLRVKLAQNWAKFEELLETTGEMPIVEFSKKDPFWGAQPQEDDTLVGGNVMGRLLMELRAHLRGPEREVLTGLVMPPDIDGLYMLGRPIGPVEPGPAGGAQGELVHLRPASQRPAGLTTSVRLLMQSTGDPRVVSSGERRLTAVLDDLCRLPDVAVDGVDITVRCAPDKAVEIEAVLDPTATTSAPGARAKRGK